MGRVLSLTEAYPMLRALYGSVIDGYVGNFGSNALAIVQSDKMIPLNLVRINIAASAGDFEVKEPLQRYEGESRQFGTVLARKLRDKSIDAVVSTGGCRYVGEWTTHQISHENPDVYQVAFVANDNGNMIGLERIPVHLKHYDLIVVPDMNRLLRSILVGTLGNILFIELGGYGSAIEEGAAADAERVVSHLQVKSSQYGVSNYGHEFLRRISYQNTRAVFLSSSNPDELVERSIAEHDIQREGLDGRLTSVVVYNRTKPDGQKRILANIRRTRLPATFYHREDTLWPMEQTLIDFPRDDVRGLLVRLDGKEPPKELPTRELEEPVFLKLMPDSDHALELTDRVREEIVRRGGRVVFTRNYGES